MIYKGIYNSLFLSSFSRKKRQVYKERLILFSVCDELYIYRRRERENKKKYYWRTYALFLLVAHTQSFVLKAKEAEREGKAFARKQPSRKLSSFSNPIRKIGRESMLVEVVVVTFERLATDLDTEEQDRGITKCVSSSSSIMLTQ